MESNYLSDVARDIFEKFYGLRLQRLKKITLDDLLPWIPRDIDLFGTHDAFAIVNRMVESYLASFEIELNQQTNNLEFCLELIQQKSDYTSLRWTYEAQMAQTLNIVHRDFLNRFLTLENGIDWEKLIHSSSQAQHS